MIQTQNKQVYVKVGADKLAFTLIELIVVVTILAILWTIAFISLQWYSASARDSKRLSDIQNIKKSLELFSLNTWKYPIADNPIEVTYSWELVRTQWTVWDQITTNLSRNLQEKPLDPLTEDEYIYSTIQSQTEYEILGLYESDLIWFSSPLLRGIEGDILSQSNATNQNYPKIDWNYNWIYVKIPWFYVPTPSIINANIWWNINFYNDNSFLTSQVITWWDNIPWVSTWLLDITLSVYEWTITSNSTDEEKSSLLEKIQLAYSWSQLANDVMYSDILSKTDLWEMVDFVNLSILKDIYAVSPSSIPPLITNADCINAWWMWVDSSNDVYIGTTRWDWYCISPRFWDWNNNSNAWDWWISWNWWWDLTSYNYYKWWNAIDITDTTNELYRYWQTRDLDSYVSYDCKTLWTATGDYETEDTIVWRMKWLAITWNTYEQAQSISWIVQSWTNNALLPLNWHAIPALYIADCIDWVKDLTTNMTYIHNDDSIDEVTYAEYNNNITSFDVNDIAKSDITYQNRQKYLIAWSQKSGWHLPSAMSYITSWYTSATDDDWDFLELKDRWEYQVACELYSMDNTTDFYGDGEGSSSDKVDWERIWLAAIGQTNGSDWWHYARIIGVSGCSFQTRFNTGYRAWHASARFVVRP